MFILWMNHGYFMSITIIILFRIVRQVIRTSFLCCEQLENLGGKEKIYFIYTIDKNIIYIFYYIYIHSLLW